MTPLKQMVFEVLEGMVDLGTTGTDRANKETLQLLTKTFSQVVLKMILQTIYG